MIALVIFLVLIAAAIAFLGATVNAKSKANLVGLGLLLLTIALLVKAAAALH